MIAGVGIAFAAVSLWVWLSRGKSASAVRAKYRLGGILLSLTVAATTLTACGGASCYAPAVEPTNTVSPQFDTSTAVYYSGDVLKFYADSYYTHFKYVITSDKRDVLYTGNVFGYYNIEVALAVGDYVGPITITFLAANDYSEEFVKIGSEFNCTIDAR